MTLGIEQGRDAGTSRLDGLALQPLHEPPTIDRSTAARHPRTLVGL